MAKMIFDGEGLLEEPCLSCDKAYIEDIWHEWCCDEKECPHKEESEGKRMNKRKHDFMYQLFGKSEGLCRGCEHFLGYRYHDRIVRKCEVYGDTRSAASDWKGSAQACGLYPDKPYNGRNVIELVHGGREPEDFQIDGQITMFQ